MYCKLCFMCVRILSSLLHVMHVCRGANLASSSSWMYIAYISLLLIYFSPLCWWLTKRGRMISSFYAYIEFMFLQKGEKHLLRLCMFISLFMHIWLFSFMHLVEYLIVYRYAWVKRELLWNLTLIHAYITPWVLSSLKRRDCWPKGQSL